MYIWLVLYVILVCMKNKIIKKKLCDFGYTDRLCIKKTKNKGNHSVHLMNYSYIYLFKCLKNETSVQYKYELDRHKDS